jgi:hypothetical protein
MLNMTEFRSKQYDWASTLHMVMTPLMSTSYPSQNQQLNTYYLQTMPGSKTM